MLASTLDWILIASAAGSWLGIAVVATLLLALIRIVGEVQHAHASATASGRRIAIGSPIPDIELLRLMDGVRVSSRRISPAYVLLLSPDCYSCKKAASWAMDDEVDWAFLIAAPVSLAGEAAARLGIHGDI